MNEISINVNVNVNAPALVQAINDFAAAFLGGMANAPQTASAAPVQQPQPVPQSQPTAQAPAPQTASSAPVQQPQQAPQPMPQPQQVPHPQPQPQPQQTPQPQPSGGVTLDAIINAGAGLVEKGMMAQVVALLGKYGLQAVNQLQPAQYAPFAAELRALGAAI